MIAYSGTLLVTTAPIPITAWSPICTPSVTQTDAPSCRDNNTHVSHQVRELFAGKVLSCTKLSF